MLIFVEKDKNINSRIVEVLDFLGVSRYKCNHETGISEMVLSNIYNNKNKPSYETIEKIMNTYNVNGNWLITGKGKMLNELN
jgi:transcriptional regulator with XRE-family HTH domain